MYARDRAQYRYGTFARRCPGRASCFYRAPDFSARIAYRGTQNRVRWRRNSGDSRAKILFVTGGLGPTTDDVTREAAAELLGLKLVRDPEVMTAISERFATRGIQFTARVERQAFVPAGAEVLPNENGTAPGLYLRANLSPHVL